MTRAICMPDGHVPAPVVTPALDEMRTLTEFLVELGEIGAVLGHAGLGKTFGVDVAAAETGLPVTTLDMPPRPAPKEVTVRLLREVQGFADTSATAYALTEELVEALADEARIVVIDEAQNLTPEGLNQLRYLHDRPSARWALVLVGGQGCRRSLDSQAQLASRVARWVELTRLRDGELLAALRQYHELFRGAPADLLLEIDDVFAHGTWRHWARFLQEALRLQVRHGYDRIDRRMARAVLQSARPRKASR